ncbi:MAG: SIS domain-containing protein [Chlorobi bacterium]|nr:SIS domain-containing protein [Chlorobiota bacterium]
MKLSDYIEHVTGHARSIPEANVEEVVDALLNVYESGKTVFVIGNGGSAANASHFAQDLAKGTLRDPAQVRRLRALSLTDNSSFMTALANDEGYEHIFVQQLKTFARPGDLLIAISGSGNSANVLRAVEWARTNDLLTVAFTGFDGGRLHSLADINVHTELPDMCATEAIHSILFHFVAEEVKRRMAERDGKR